MAVEDVELLEESRKRYLTYALSVVSSRALPDVRDGLKPVQRRILYAMAESLHLNPEKPHRKSAAVVGEVLARFHPHGDAACYEALVRMAQSFSLRYPLIDGQGNFGSMDGDGAAAYRYTEARLTKLALEVIGDIGQETVAERDNFDQTLREPVVLPSRVPNLLINGSAGIAVGMATAIPPHNLRDVVKALLLLLDDESTSDEKLLATVQGPDFPTGCQVLNTRSELRQIYSTGRGAIRMRGEYTMEKSSRGKTSIVITSIPYGIDKSVLVEKIADLITARKVPQLVDVRDESTDVVRVVLELNTGGDGEKAMAYLFKHTPLEQNFNVNLTALVPSANPLLSRPRQLSLRDMLCHFVDFRLAVTRAKLLFEKEKLAERVHLLEGLIKVADVIDAVIAIVRKSSGRSDAAEKLIKRFSLSEKQAFFIVDLRIYQLTRTSIEEISAELAEKRARIAAIEKLLRSEKALKGEIGRDLTRIAEEYGDARRSKIVEKFEETAIEHEEYVEHEEIYVIVSRDGWLKRIRKTSDPASTRMREGDSLFYVAEGSTRDTLAIFSNLGNVFVTSAYEIVYTTGFGEPVQKMFRFQDGEQIVSCLLLKRSNGVNAMSGGQISLFDERQLGELFVFSRGGFGFRIAMDFLTATKKVGKRLAKFSSDDRVLGVCPVTAKLALLVSEEGYGVCFPVSELPLLSGAGKGVILQRLPRGDKLACACCVEKSGRVKVLVQKGAVREISVAEMEIGSRAKRGLKVVKRGAPVLGMA